MRMDENSNPEWKKMLEGSSSGRKALERIRSLEAENQRLRDALEAMIETYVPNNIEDMDDYPVVAIAKQALEKEI